MLGTIEDATTALLAQENRKDSLGNLIRLGAGCSRTAYLNRDTGVVYKVGDDEANDMEYMLYIRSLIMTQVWGIAKPKGVDVAETGRFRVFDGSGRERTIVSMEYVEGETYFDWTEMKRAARAYASDDVHNGNVRTREDGTFVLIDLGFGTPEWAENLLNIPEWEMRERAAKKAERERVENAVANGATFTRCNCYTGCIDGILTINRRPEMIYAYFRF